MKSTFKLFGLAAAMLLPLLSQAQNVDFRCSFENYNDSASWTIVNSSTANKWYIDSAVAVSGGRSLYISSDGGVSNVYNTNISSVSYAYQAFWLDSGDYYVSYNWQCYGESLYDYLRVFLAPVSDTFQADYLPGNVSSYDFASTVPSGWICLSGTNPLNGVSTWQNYSAPISVSTPDSFNLVFLWCSDASAGNYPAAAVDDIRLSQVFCLNTATPTISNLTDSSFVLSWSDTVAYMWYVELDSAGQAQGTDYIYTLTDTSITFSNLLPNSTYHVYLACDCNGDTSYWTHLTVTTNCLGISQLPMTESFETYVGGGVNSTAFVDCWGHVNNHSSYLFGYPYIVNTTNASHNGGSKGLYWYSYGDAGPYKGVILPAINNTLYPIDTLQLSFWAKATSNSYTPVFVVGIIPNTNDINTFVPYRTVNITSGTEWQKVTVDFSTYNGPAGRIAVMTPRTTNSWYAYTDDFTIETIPACSQVTRTHIDRIGSASALVSWTLQGGSANTVTDFEIQYDTVGATGYGSTETVSDSPYILSGLLPGSEYKLRVRALCGLEEGAWDSTTFTTGNLPCLVSSTDVDTIVYSTGTASTTGVFVYSGWGNTFSEAIYTANDLANAGLSAGRITAITVGYNSAGSYQKDISIFMGNTSLNNFSTASSMVDVSELTEVCHNVLRPNTSASTGWVTYQFTTPFYWDGSSNIVIAFFVNQHGSNQTSSGFYAYSTATSPTRSGASAYRYKDSNPFTAANQTSFSGSGTSSYLPSISFHSSECLQHSNCNAPLLVLSRVDLDTVVIDWGAGNTETSWDISYRSDDDSVWTVINNVTERQYIFTGLTPQTHYTVRVAPNCGGDSLYSTVDFTIPCLPVTTLPFTEDFENFTAPSTSGSAITQCWTRTSNYPSSSYPYNSTSYAFNGTHSMYFYSYSNYYSTLVLPMIDIPIDSLQISFAAYKTSANYNLLVGVMTDPDDFSTFVPIDTVSPSSVSNWEMFEVAFNNYTGNGRYIALASYGNSSNYMYIDDITVDYIPNCPRPRDITFRNILTTTAVASWTGASNEYIIEYGPYGFNHGEGIETYSYNDSVTLYGLVHSTRYQVYVRTVCGVDDTSDWSFATAFTTQCSEIDTLPFREEFVAWGIGTTARPDCWSMGGYSSYPYIVNLTTPDSVYRALNMYTYSSSQTYASLPPLDSISQPINTTQVVITAVSNNSSSYSHILVVGTCTQQGNLSTFTPVDTLRLTDIVNTYEVAFDTVSTGAKYITLVSQTERGLYYNYAYVIDVQVEAIPPCQVPNRVRATNVTAVSADIHWNDRNNASSWQVEYGPRGFALGTGTRATVTANPYPLTALNPSTTYDFYVRSICAVGDTSTWNRAPMRFSTLQQPAAVPYFYDFETPNEWSNWQTCSNVASDWYRDTAAGSGSLDGSGRYSIYISSDSGATVSTDLNAVVNAVAYRDFDFGTDPYHTYQVSFRAKSGGTPSNGYDGLMMLHVDPTTPVEASSLNINSPWGHPDSIERHFFIRCNGYWNTYTATFDTLTGIHRFALYWFNQSNTGFVGVPAAVDDFRIISFDCPRPAGVRAENVTISTADLTWVGPDFTDYRVVVRNQSGVTFSLDTIVNTNQLHLTGLSSANTYLVNVRRICDSSTVSSNSVAYTFMTQICNGGTNDTLATANTVTSTYLPIYTGSNYSYTQQLVLASELPGAGEISALNLRYAGSITMTEHTNCTISMGHTSMSSFGTNYVNPDSLTVVYTGAIRSDEDWSRLIFHSPFLYNGSDNIVIAIDDNSNRHSTSSSSQYFAADQMSSTMAICYSSSSDIVPTNSNLANLSSIRSALNLRNQMILEICPPNTCTPPSLRTPVIRSGRVTLRWSNTSDRYSVSYRPEATTSWTVDQVNVTEPQYDITRVNPNTNYVYRVRQFCDSTGISHWTYGTFNSNDIPCLAPESLRVNNVTNRRVTLAWTPAENNVTYHLHVFNTAFDQMDTCYLSRCTVTGLEAGVTYYAAVRAECNGFDQPGEFSDTIQFTTPICPDASHLIVTEVYGNSAVLDWTPGGEETAWEILYGDRGFREENGVSVMADHHPFTLTDLFGSTDYQAYIRTHCGDNFPGEHWVGPVDFTTLYSAIENVSDDSRVRLQPNPTRGDVTVSLPEGYPEVFVEVLDIAGRSCMNLHFSDNGNSLLIPSSKLPAGTYFLRITASDINTVKKLIVR